MVRPTLNENLELLESMRRLAKQNTQNSPGPYWRKTAKATEQEIRKKGLANFRSYGSNVGQSYADTPIIDVRPSLLGLLPKLIRYLVTSISPFKNVFDNQVNLTKSIYSILLEKESHHLQHSARIDEALNNLRLPKETTLGNCVAVTRINYKSVSNLYLENLSIIHNLNRELEFKDVSSFMEIGAGFGVNIHLLLENFPNIKKILIVDICPTLYVSTQYLRAFFGESVIDCVEFNSKERKEFSDNSDLEIICILPSQLENFSGVIDCAYNAHSFVEMTPEIVSRYGKAINRLQPEGSPRKLALCTYQTIGNNKTVSYRDLPQLLGLSMREVSDTWPRDGYNLNTYFFSSGKPS